MWVHRNITTLISAVLCQSVCVCVCASVQCVCVKDLYVHPPYIGHYICCYMYSVVMSQGKVLLWWTQKQWYSYRETTCMTQKPVSVGCMYRTQLCTWHNVCVPTLWDSFHISNSYCVYAYVCVFAHKTRWRILTNYVYLVCELRTIGARKYNFYWVGIAKIMA